MSRLWPITPATAKPMLASVGIGLPGAGWAYEPKYDGIRVLAFVSSREVRLMTRNHKDKAAQFPEITEAFRTIAKRTRRTYVVDGEIVAVHDGSPLRFQQLQQRMQVQDRASIQDLRHETPTAIYLFDLLADGTELVVDLPWTRRLERLHRRFDPHESAIVRLTESLSGRGETLMRRARAQQWEGVMAKRMDAPYRMGERTGEWQKLKVEHRQEFVVGGYTEPRRSRQYFGALLLGYYENGHFMYAGHTGGGFTRETLKVMYDKLQRRHRVKSPFHPVPRTNERAHWVRPDLVVEVKFNEWTSDGRLRQPIFVGFRNDKEARDVTRESELHMTHLDKPFFPKLGKTKGDVMRYYTDVAPLILPTIKDRPLVLKRYPDGVGGASFYQQNAGDNVPADVRTEVIRPAGEPQRRFVGGDLTTLLYTVQLGAISVDPWHSRITSLDDADYTILDLDPGTTARFRRVIAVARAVKQVLDDVGLHGALKTSGATGLHVYLPLPKGTDNGTALLVAQIIATEVATRYPKEATVKRAVRGRSPAAVYVDYLQNIRGKTVAGPYSLRATPDATVSTPLSWDELTDDLDPREFTIDTAPARFASTGDVWRTLMRRPNTLKNLLRVTDTRPTTTKRPPTTTRGRPKKSDARKFS